MIHYDVEDLDLDEVALVRRGFEPVNPPSTISVVKAQTSQATLQELAERKAKYTLASSLFKSLRDALGTTRTEKAVFDDLGNAADSGGNPGHELDMREGAPFKDTAVARPLGNASAAFGGEEGSDMAIATRTNEMGDLVTAITQLQERIASMTGAGGFLEGAGTILPTAAQAFSKADAVKDDGKDDEEDEDEKPRRKRRTKKSTPKRTPVKRASKEDDGEEDDDEDEDKEDEKDEKPRRKMTRKADRHDPKEDDDEEDDEDDEDEEDDDEDEKPPRRKTRKATPKKRRPAPPVEEDDDDDEDDDEDEDDDDDEDCDDDAPMSKANAGAATAKHARGHASSASKEATQFLTLLRHTLDGQGKSADLEEAVTKALAPLLTRLSDLETNIQEKVTTSMDQVLSKAEEAAITAARVDTTPPLLTRSPARAPLPNVRGMDLTQAVHTLLQSKRS